MKFNKYAVLTKSALLISPILAFFFLCVQVKKGVSQGAAFVVSFFFAILSLRYLPSFSNDKARYIERNKTFSEYSFEDFLVYLQETHRPDYLFDLLNFIFAAAGVNVRYFFFFITFLTVYSVFLFFNKSLRSLAGTSLSFSKLTFFFIALSFSLTGLLSGLRFILAGSFFIWVVYFFYFDKKFGKAVFFAFLALSTHFSFFYLLVVLGLSYFLVNFNVSVLRLFLILSFGFYFLSVDFLSSIFGVLSFSESYYNKILLYSEFDRESSRNALILSYLKNLWFYFAAIYLILDKKKSDEVLLPLLLLLFSAINFVSSFPIAFGRYIVVAKILFLLYILSRSALGRMSNKYFYAFLILYMLGFMVDLLVLRVNFQESLSFSDFFLTVFSLYSGGAVHKVLY